MMVPHAPRFPQFDKIYKLNGIPVITVQLRYNGWVTEMKDPEKVGHVCFPASSFNKSVISKQ